MQKIEFDPAAVGPLDGVTVLDMTRLVSGNMLSLQLADFGAEVIKVESPQSGDPLRDWKVKGVSTHWKVYGRNKKSLTLNLRDPQAHAAFCKLVAQAQVLIENFRPGTLEGLFCLGQPAVRFQRDTQPHPPHASLGGELQGGLVLRHRILVQSQSL